MTRTSYIWPLTTTVLAAAVGVVAALVILLGSSALPAQAQSTPTGTTITVNTDEDEDNADGDCTLREAVIAANTDAARDACPAGTGNDTITVPAGTYTLTLGGAGEDAAATGDLDVTEALTIKGAGADSTSISGGTGFGDRIFHNHRGVSTTISGLTVTGGSLPYDRGGGIYNEDGTLTVSDSTISGNTTVSDGGGIATLRGTLTVERSTISGNTANSSGGGVYSFTNPSNFSASNTTITNSTISGNNAGPNGGGGVRNFVGLTKIEYSTITDNTATNDNGSGVWSYGYTDTRTEVISSIISGNENTDVKYGDSSTNTNSFFSGGYNIIGSGNGVSAFNASGDRTGISDPKLGPLQYNGGPTKTMALLADSPALDAVPPSVNGCGTTINTDQRGVTRPQGTACDVGAFELTKASSPPPDKDKKKHKKKKHKKHHNKNHRGGGGISQGSGQG